MKNTTRINIEEYDIKYGPMVMRRCLFLLKDEDIALEAMHDIFVKVLKNENKLKLDYPSSLIYKITTNVCLDIINSKE
ncbi:MAG: hypothetical protein OEZ22_14445 [Spirochaetia bacterium]|nr:hypothetical protein [Spirochaetia bacterium]